MKKIIILSAILLSAVLNLNAQNKVDFDIKTGADNLDPKDFMQGLKITLKIRGRADIVKENVNESREWPNNSIRRVSFDIPNDVPCADIYEAVLSRLPKSNSFNNITATVGDNWNLQKLTVTTRIRVNGVLQSKSMDWISPSGSNNPLFRFVYENRDTDRNTGTTFTVTINNQCPLENGPILRQPDLTNFARSINCIFGTGGDDLRGGNDNVNIRLKLRGAANRIITISNLNNGNTWGNFTENTVSKDLTARDAAFTIQDIELVEVHHTGGGGIGADNWYLDKFKLSITLNGIKTVLVDKIDTPIHYFTGDTRIKRFYLTN